MTKIEAISFLEANQPLPSDADMTQEQIIKFDEIRKYLIKSPDPVFIPLMLNAFGNGSGFGVYQLCDAIFLKYSKDQVLPHLRQALQSPHWGVRCWAAEWAMDFPDETLIPELKVLTKDDHSDCHFGAILALKYIWLETGSEKALQIISDQRNITNDPELLELIDEVLNEAKTSEN